MSLSHGKRLRVLGDADVRSSEREHGHGHGHNHDHDHDHTHHTHDAPERDDGVSRRRFLELMGASLALGGMAACTRQPPEQIVPYVRQPEEIVPGRPLFYATSMVHEGYALGLLAESHMGRPTKIEGNPDHPASLGATDTFAQASVLTLYDPDRSQAITLLGRISTWERLTGVLGEALQAERAAGGAGIRILTETVTSPTLADQLRGFLRDFPAAKWHQHQPCGRGQAHAGAARAFGEPVMVRYDFRAADVVLALDADFLASGPGSVRYSRDFSARRDPRNALGMNRLYAVESTPTATGTIADHRLPLNPGEVNHFALLVAAELGVPGVTRPATAPPPELQRWASAVARDLRARAGRSLVIAGDEAPPAVHVLVHAMNEILGNAGVTVLYTDPVEAAPVDQTASLRELADDMRIGRVRLLVILGGNPVFTAPADLGFAEAMQRVALRIHLSLYSDETSAYCQWHVPESHYLEAWGDARAFDGTAGIIQPLIEPLYASRSAHEMVAALSGQKAVSGLDLVRGHWRGQLGEDQFEARWRTALHNGLFAETALPARRVAVRPDAIAGAAAEITAAPPAGEGYDLLFRADPSIGDGRFANNGWLQELPKPHTTLTWDNAALVSPKAAERLGLTSGDMVELSRAGKTLKIPVFILPGQADRSVTVHLGHGRTLAGKVGNGTGFNAYQIRTSDALWFGPGLSIRKTGETYPLALTQLHFSLEGRRHVQVATLDELQNGPDLHKRLSAAPPKDMTLYPEWKNPGHAWGMAIDLTACTGCSACVVACQAENNIPVVGKVEVLQQREMHWIRIDRYYEGDLNNPEIYNEPMLCVHCENAPCEPVCPVGATTHSADGLNEMTYNRCVGTRYCSNNCPYKVRRFNFFNYTREDRSLRLLRNPDVTVRSRGVMEKCTYCVQRIRGADIEEQRRGSPMRDGELVTACQQACPTGAIVFGDINDPGSRVRKLKEDPRNYGVLEELNTRPRTTHLAKIKNQNPELAGSG